MPDALTALAPQPPAIPRAAEPKPPTVRTLRVNGRLKAALDLMVFGQPDGDNAGIALGWLEASRTAKYHVAAMRRALERPDVIRYLREQKQVFRASASAQNISALVQLRDKSGNAMAQLGAIRVLEQIDDVQAASSAVRSPGFQILILNQPSTPAPSQQAITVRAQPIEDDQ